MASGAAKNRMLEQKRFFHTRMTHSQSLWRQMARWNWTTPVWYLLILEFKSMKRNFTQLLCAIHKVVYIPASLWLSAHKTLAFVFHKVV